MSSTEDQSPVTTLQRAASWLLYFCRYATRQFYQQRGLQVAASLAYATLLSLVPLLTVMFAFPGGLPVFGKLSDLLQTFIFNNFVPEFGDTVRGYLSEFSVKASQLTITGIIALVLIALLLMNTIDNALNHIWHVRRQRRWASRFLVYWAMITLGPLLVGFGLFSTSYLLSLPLVSDVGSSFDLRRRVLSLLPFLSTSAAFSMLYVLVPNCYVRVRHAMAGGIAAAILFELAKYGFGIYVRSTPTEQIYGALATVPLFLVWIYLSWAIVLLGAHFTFCLAEFRLEREKAGLKDRQWEFEDAFQVLRTLWQAQVDGHTVTARAMQPSGIRLPQYQVNEIMECLGQANWVERTADGGWMLARDMGSLTLKDLHLVIPRRLPVNGIRDRGDPWLLALEEIIQSHFQDMSGRLGISLEELMKRGATPP